LSKLQSLRRKLLPMAICWSRGGRFTMKYVRNRSFFLFFIVPGVFPVCLLSGLIVPGVFAQPSAGLPRDSRRREPVTRAAAARLQDHDAQLCKQSSEWFVRHTSHVTRHTSHVTPGRISQRYHGDLVCSASNCRGCCCCRH